MNKKDIYGKDTKQGFSEGWVSNVNIEEACLSLDRLINLQIIHNHQTT